MDDILRTLVAVEFALATLVAVYEGRAWAHRQSSIPWSTMFRPDALFRARLFTDEGNRLRRVAVRWLVALVLLGGLLLLLGRLRDG